MLYCNVSVLTAVAASQRLVLAVQKLQRLPADMQAEGALAALRLIAEVHCFWASAEPVFSLASHLMAGELASNMLPLTIWFYQTAACNQSHLLKPHSLI